MTPVGTVGCQLTTQFLWVQVPSHQKSKYQNPKSGGADGETSIID